jgi:hypothetical protein
VDGHGDFFATPVISIPLSPTKGIYLTTGTVANADTTVFFGFVGPFGCDPNLLPCWQSGSPAMVGCGLKITAPAEARLAMDVVCVGVASAVGPQPDLTRAGVAVQLQRDPRVRQRVDRVGLVGEHNPKR